MPISRNVWNVQNPRFRISRTAFVTAAILFVMSLILVACGDEDETATPGAGVEPTATQQATPSPAPDEEIEHPTGADDLVLQIDVSGGIAAEQVALLETPWIVMYGDGRVITQGPVIAIYPPPALPNLQESRLSPEGMQTLLRAAHDSGLLDGDADYTSSIVADAQTTTFIVNADGSTNTVTVYGLELDELPPDTSADEIEARDRLRIFRQQAVDYHSLVDPGDVVAPEHAFEIKRLQLVILPAAEAVVPSDPAISPGTTAWPLATPSDEIGESFDLPGSRCVVIEDDELGVMLSALEQANQLTQWESGAELYAVYPRPLLPHEDGCEPLQHATITLVRAPQR